MTSAILRIWNKYKPRLCLKIPLLVSAQEAFYRTETANIEKWLTYQDLLIKMKSREQLTTEVHSFQWFLYAQLKERFGIDKKVTGIE